MLRTVPAQLTATDPGYGAWLDCVAAGRIAAKLRQGLRHTHERAELAADRTFMGLEQLLHVSDSFTIVAGAGDGVRLNNDNLIVGTFDETDHFALFGLFIGEDRGDAPFYTPFNLTTDEAALVEEGTLGFIAAYIPKENRGEAIKAVAIMALGPHNWDYDAYKLPDENLGLYTTLVAKAKEALAAL